jgi:hypothetical protein
LELRVRWSILYLVSRIGRIVYDDRKSCSFECDTAAREALRSTEASPGRIRWALVFGKCRINPFPHPPCR